MNTDIYITYSCEGFHRWKDANGKRSYLASLHRHLFQVKVIIEVFHEDREVEFHDLLSICKNESQVFISEHDWSCETHAKYLVEKLKTKYDGRTITVEVSEDGECGAIVKHDPNSDE